MLFISSRALGGHNETVYLLPSELAGKPVFGPNRTQVPRDDGGGVALPGLRLGHNRSQGEYLQNESKVLGPS